MARGLLPASLKKFIPAVIATGLTLFFLVLAINHLNLYDGSVLTSIENLWIDGKFKFRGEQLPGGEVVVVGIDDKTLTELGSFRTLSHDKYATVVDRLSESGAKVIAFDILFPDRDANAENDRLFAESIARAGNVVMGIHLDLATDPASDIQGTEMTEELRNLVVEKQIFPAERRTGGGERAIRGFINGRTLQLPLPELVAGSQSFGFVNFHPDAQGRLRYQPQFIEYQGRLYPSMDLQILRAYLDAPSTMVTFEGERILNVQVGDRVLPTDDYGRFMLNFNGGTPPVVSMIDVMEGRVPRDRIEGKIAIVAAYAVGLGDIRPTPFDPVAPGVLLHANVIDNALRQNYLYRDSATEFLDVATIVFFGILLGLYLPRMDATRSVFYSSLIFGLFAVMNVVAFLTLQWVLGFVYPGVHLLGTSAVLISYKYLTEERERKRTKQTFQHYLDEHVIEQVMNQPEMLKLGGEKREMSVLFSDIRGFTSFSEKMAPAEVVAFLNQYFDRMTGLIFQYKGTLDKLIGDAVMCFWGHPIETKDHALRATLCALEMIQGVEDLRPVLMLPGGARFEIGIGVNTGPMVVGNMGSQTRFSYTVMGDNVNLGSRLEALTKYYGIRIILSDTAYEACKEVVFCRQLDTIQVKGKSAAVTIYEPLGVRRLQDDRRHADRRGQLTLGKKIKRALVLARYGERRHEERRMGSDRLLVKPEQEEVASMYEHALALYRRGDFDAAEAAFDHVLALNPGDGPSRLLKSRIPKYREEYAGVASTFDGVYKFDEK